MGSLDHISLEKDPGEGACWEVESAESKGIYPNFML